MPSIGFYAPLRRATLATMVAGLVLAGGRWFGGGLVTAAESDASPHQMRLQSSSGRSVRATLREGGLDVADANGAAFAISDVMDAEHPPLGLTFDLKVEAGETGVALRLIELSVHRADRLAGTVSRAADGSFRLVSGAQGVAATASVGPAFEAPVVLQGPMEDVLFGDPGTTSDAAIILKAARLFARKLDMTRDLALGDPVRLVFTRRLAADGQVLGPGDLLYAEVDTRDGPTQYYRHRSAGGGDIEFVDAAGAPSDHGLLRTPLDRPRITSDFGMRLHPLLGYTRMHEGLDFGAPVGSAVVAAGDGVVEQLRWAGGYGRWIKLRHSASLETGYGHLSAWAPGLREGSPIKQGQLIGYVGSSGLSTGPHLHYEVLQSGRAVDPKQVQVSDVAPLKGAERVAFEQEKQRVASLLKGPPLAAPRQDSANLGGGY